VTIIPLIFDSYNVSLKGLEGIVKKVVKKVVDSTL